MEKVTTILTGYKRPEYFIEQFNAVKNQQDVDSSSIIYIENTIPGVQYYDPIHTFNNIVAVKNNINQGVWFRFAVALTARTDWVCVLDDDTIPGPKWYKNCLEHQKTHFGLHGTIGVIIPENGQYHNVHRVGWDNPNSEIKQVDFVGQNWWFHRDILSYFWREIPPIDHNLTTGEDMNFSAMLQKYSEYKTWVPPHPKECPEMWGSLKGWAYGDDGKATASTSMHLMQKDLDRYVSGGFRLMMSGDRHNNQSIL